jgi:OOP family OmpA-OmpF porin
MRNSTRTRRWDGSAIQGLMVVVLVALAMLTLAALASAQSVGPQPTVNYAPGGGGKVTGTIISRRGDDLLLRDDAKRISVITLVEGTRITSPTGFLNLDRKSQNVTSLIPGLIIAVHGSGGQSGNLIADRISFKKSAHRVATQIAAGEVELKAQDRVTAQRAQANSDSIAMATARARSTLDSLETTIKTRMSDLDTYDVKLNNVVYFTEGKAVLSDEAKRNLDNLVSRGQGLQGYIIEVAGFASAEGTEAFNQKLSEQRADAVVAYLTQQHNVPLRRIVNPTGLGTSHAVASNDTPKGRAENRRAEVKVLVNRGLVSNQP